MWVKFQTLDVKVKWGIAIVIAVLFVLAAIYGSPSQPVVSQ